MTLPWYCTRETVKSALDVKETAWANSQVDRAIDSGARTVEGLTHRRFYPELRTMTWDWPNWQYAEAWRLWLNANELISVITLTAGGVTIGAGDYLLRPDDGPPYTHIELNLSSSAAFGGGSTHQRTISVTGLYGYRDDETTAGTLAEALDTSETAVDVSNAAAAGVGDIIRADDERMIVVGRQMLDSGQNIGADLASLQSAGTVAVSTGAAYSVGEALLIDAERMLVVDIAGNNLIVKRAWDGSTLAAHTTGADIYASRTLTVERGALGTAAASHSNAATVYRHQPPGLVRDLNAAYAINQLLQEGSGYARVAGTGDNAREFTGRGIAALEDAVRTRYGRMARLEAV